jgi:hypothetical protein
MSTVETEKEKRSYIRHTIHLFMLASKKAIF